MKQNSMYKKGVVIAVIVLFVGVSVLPATGSIVSEEPMKTTFYENDGEDYINSAGRQMKSNIRLSQSHFLDDEGKLYSVDRAGMSQRKESRYEMVETSLEEVVIDTSSKDDYIPHDPIVIKYNSNFTAENGVVSGNGTIDNPYIIEGWEIKTLDDYGALIILETTAYFIVRNCYLRGRHVGILLDGVDHGTFDDIVVPSGPSSGILIKNNYLGASDLIITNSTFYSETGLEMWFVDNISVSNCYFDSSEMGMLFYTASYIDITNVTVQNGGRGIAGTQCHYTTITDCEVLSNNMGISIIASGHWVLRNNTLNGNNIGFDISSLISEDDYILDIDTSNTVDGEPVHYLRGLSDQVIDGNEGFEFIGLLECNNITVKNLDLSNSGNSFIIALSQDCILTNSTFDSNRYGIDCAGSSNTRITNCVVTGIVAYGIFLVWSSNTIMRNNIISNGGSFGVFGEKSEDFYHDIDLSNTVNGKPIYYLVGESNMRITRNTEIGYLALVNCNNMRVIDVEINSTSEQGLLLVDTTGLIRGCRFNYNYAGIQIFGDSKITIYGCKVSFNLYGFYISQASNVRMIRCRVLSNSFYGISLDNSHDNLIIGCNIAFNGYSEILSEYSWSNVICFNSIIGNSYGGISLYTSNDHKILYNKITGGVNGIQIHEGSCGNEVHHNSIKGTEFVGVDIYDSSNNNNIFYNTIENHEVGVWVLTSVGNQFDHNNIVGNEDGMILTDAEVDAEENWWGSDDGPGGIGPGSGDTITISGSSTVSYEPWLEKPVRIIINGILYFIKSIFGLNN